MKAGFCVIFVLVLAILENVSGARKKNFCTKDFKTRYCGCSSRDPTWVKCNDKSSLAEFQEVLKIIKDVKLSKLSLIDSKIGYLPSDIFRGMAFKDIEFEHVEMLRMGTFTQPPFLGLEDTLENLTLSNCFESENFPLNRVTLSHLNKLKYLTFNANELPTISKEWFENGPRSLEELYFKGNDISKFEDLSLTFLNNLKKIWIQGNKLKSVTRKMFPQNAKNLNELNLSDNELTSLPDDIFSGMESLKSINLNGNGFETLDGEPWKSVWKNLDSVYLEGNPLVCNSTLSWICDKSIRSNLPRTFKGTCYLDTGDTSKRSVNLKDLTLDLLKKGDLF